MEINQKNLIKCFLSDLAAKEVKAGLNSFFIVSPIFSIVLPET